MDAIEKFVADLICQAFKVTDPAKVAQVEANAPKVVDGVVAIVAVVQTIRGK